MSINGFDSGDFPAQSEHESERRVHQLAHDIALVIQNAAELRGRLTRDEVLAALDAVCDEMNDIEVVPAADMWETFVQEHVDECRSKRCRFGDEFNAPNMDSPDCQACFELWELTR